MREHHVSVPRTARYFTLGAPARARDIWVVCHGYGQLASRFLERFQPIAGEHRAVVAPEALSRFYASESPRERRVGASWMTREDRLHEIDDYVRYLDAVHADVVPARARVTALGFSQGAATASRWAALGTARVDRLIVWGGELPPDLDLTQPRVVERLRTSHVTLVYGVRDEFFPAKIVTATRERLHQHHILHEAYSFDGGHEIHEPTLARLA